MVKEFLASIIVVSAAVLMIGIKIGMLIAPQHKQPCGQPAVSLQPINILEYKTIVCSFSDKEQNYFCSPWEPAVRSTPKPSKAGGIR